jgi:hypothetical protein
VVNNLKIELLKKIVHLIEYEIVNNKSNEKLAENVLSSFGTINNATDLFDLEVNGHRIGYGILSTFFSKTRNINPSISNKFLHFINDSLLLNLNILQTFQDNFKEFDEFLLFNGRGIDTRVVLDFCNLNNQKITIVENVLIAEDKYSIEYLPGKLPQDVEFRSQQIETTWDLSDLEYNEKIKIGSEYFEERFRGSSSTRDKIFNENWKTQYIPKSDKSINRILILVSSEDEGLAIPEILHLNLFRTQLEGIHFILHNTNQIHNQFILRIHPNLKDVKFQYHQDLKHLDDKYTNIEILNADSSINTYSIFPHVNKVICFGSTAGIEAAFFGLPVINCSATFYQGINAVYNPKNKTELIQYLENENLESLQKLNAIKFGFYMKMPHLYSLKNKTFLMENKIFNFKYYNFEKILKSYLAFKIMLKTRFFISKIFSNKTELETNEKLT